MTYSAIILAGGSGTRLGSDIPKQFLRLNGKTVLCWTVETFQRVGFFDEIIIVCHRDHVVQVCETFSGCKVIEGGASRQESTLRGVRQAVGDYVFIHDAVRPFVGEGILQECKKAIEGGAQAVDVALPATDTIITTWGSQVQNIPNRAYLAQGQTPQVFDRALLLRALECCYPDITDDCGAWIQHYRDRYPIRIVQGSAQNIKITTKADLLLAERLAHLAELPVTCNYQSLHDARVLILGGTGGIGSAVAQALQTYTTNMTSLGHDVQAENSVLNLPDKTYDIIVHAIGFLNICAIKDMGVQDWDRYLNVHLRSAFLVLQYASTHLTKDGAVIFIGSSSCYQGRAGYAAYSASKAGLVNLTQAASEEFSFRVNCINPPRTNTQLRRKIFPNEDVSTLMQPDSVAQAVIQCLASGCSGKIIDLRLV